MLEQVEGAGAGDGLRTALHPQLATEVIHVPFHHVDAQHQAMSNLAVRRSLQQQTQHLALTLGEGFGKCTGARGQRKVRGLQFPQGGKQGSLPDTF